MTGESRKLPFGLGLRYPYKDYFDRQRAIGLLYFMLAIGVFVLILGTISLASVFSGRLNFADADFEILGLNLIFAIFITYLVQNGRVQLASQIVVLLAFVVSVITMGALTLMSWATLNILVIVATGLLLNRIWLTLSLVAVVLNLLRFVIATNQTLAQALGAGFATTILLIMLIGVLFYLFNGLFLASMRREMDANTQMTAIGQFMKQMTRKDEDAVYSVTMRFIRNELGYNFVQVFLVDDETGTLRTRLRLGIGVEDILRNEVRINETNALSQALRTAQPVFVKREDSEFRRDHFLPSTKFGVALPIIARDEVVAILDVQDMAGGFSKMRMSALLLLTEQLGIILEDLTTISALRQVLNEQSITIENLRQQLREYKQYEKQVVGGVWDEYLQGRGYEAVGFDLTYVDNLPKLTPSFNLSSDLATLTQTKEVQITHHADGHAIAVPIILRGEVIGGLRFVLPQENPPSERQLDLIQNIVDRLALALENKRLFEQSRSQALRERKANDVARELIGATEVREVLNLAAKMFTETLGAVHTRIQLQPDVMKSVTTLTPETPRVSADGQDQQGAKSDA